MTNDALEQAIATLATQQDMVEHRLLTLIRDFDQRKRAQAHGLPTTAAWLGFRIGLSKVAAREKVRVANALSDLPAIDEAFAKGQVSYSKVRAMTRIATPANEAKLLYMATQATAAQLDVICRGVARSTPAESPPERWFRKAGDGDGMVVISARMHADEAALLLKAIDRVREDASAKARPDRVDGLLRLADATLAERSGGDRQQLVVTIQASALTETGIATEVDGHAATPETLKRLACDASRTVIVTDAVGDPLDVGRKTRTIPPAIRRALHHRDGGCRFAGCTHRHWLDAHHIEHWVDGGETKKDNLVLLCGAHHRLIHEGGFTVGPDLTFRRPDGSLITRPAPAQAPLELPNANPPRPIYVPNPNYNWAIGNVVRAAQPFLALSVSSIIFSSAARA